MKISAQPPSSAYAPHVATPDHPLRCRQGTMYPHRVVLFVKIGAGVHACHWCRRAVEWRGVLLPSKLVVFVDRRGHRRADIDKTEEAREGAVELVTDHLDGDPRNNTPENLVPACRTCNMRRALAGNPRIFGMQTPKTVSKQVVATIRRLRERALQLLRGTERDTRTAVEPSPEDRTSVWARLRSPPANDDDPSNNRYEPKWETTTSCRVVLPRPRQSFFLYLLEVGE